MATIYSLPPELIRLIFELSSEEDGAPEYTRHRVPHEDFDRRNNLNEIGWREIVVTGFNYYCYLCTMSLVCRAWYEEASALLWQRVYISDFDEAERLLASPMLGQRRTTSLTIGQPQRAAFSEADHEQVGRILNHLQGLRKVDLECCRQEEIPFDLRLLCSERHKDLQALELHHFTIRDTQPSDGIPTFRSNSSCA